MKFPLAIALLEWFYFNNVEIEFIIIEMVFTHYWHWKACLYFFLDVLKKYSSFVGAPIEVNSQQINSIKPLWLLEPKVSCRASP